MNGYEYFFDDCSNQRQKVVLEATPDYLYQRTPLEVLPMLNPVPTIIFILRKPENRVYSLFQFAKNSIGVIEPEMTFPRFIEKVKDKQTDHFGRRLIQKNVLDHSKYIVYIARWMEAFKPEKI